MTKLEVEHVHYRELLADIKNIVMETLSSLLESKNNQLDSLVSRKDAALILKVSEQTIDNYRKKNRLPSFIVGGNIRFKKADIMNLLT